MKCEQLTEQNLALLLDFVDDEIGECAQGASLSLRVGYPDATGSDTFEHKENAALVDDAGVSVQLGELELAMLDDSAMSRHIFFSVALISVCSL